jgi:competence protein ComEA
MKKAAMVVTLLGVALILAWAVPAMADVSKVNINTATRDQLLTLDGIGESYADRIIEYRTTNGPFQTPSDLVKVKGIGEKTYEMNKDRIIVQEKQSTTPKKPSDK